jgi:uncharacterized lipoprotein YajG
MTLVVVVLVVALLFACATTQQITAVSPTLTQTLLVELTTVSTVSMNALFQSFRFRVTATA